MTYTPKTFIDNCREYGIKAAWANDRLITRQRGFVDYAIMAGLGAALAHAGTSYVQADQNGGTIWQHLNLDGAHLFMDGVAAALGIGMVADKKADASLETVVDPSQLPTIEQPLDEILRGGQ